MAEFETDPPEGSALFILKDITDPYPGLRPFESWEAEIFFGRQAHTQRLLEILRDQGFLAVIGPSGSGKSSLVRAGLLPQLPRGRLGTGTRWRVAIVRPGNEPIRSLARALLQRDVLGPSLLDENKLPRNREEQTLGVALLEAELRRGPRGLVQAAQTAARRETRAMARVDADVDEARPDEDGDGEPPFNLLVLVDQFEELFTYLDAGGEGNRDEQAREADAFVNLLLTARLERRARVFVVLTLRTDFLGQCVRFIDLPDAINRAQYLTPRLTRPEIELAIVGPAKHFGGDVEPRLLNELINAVGTDPDQLPLLQHALSRMWENARKRTKSAEPTIGLKDFLRVGGVHDALSKHADHALANLSAQKKVGDVLTRPQEVTRQLFLAITERRTEEGGGQTVRRPQSLERIVEWTGIDELEIAAIVNEFAGPGINFLHYEADLRGFEQGLRKNTVIDISHEALIRQWQRLRDWVAEEARRAADFRRLGEKAEEHAKERAGSGLLTGAGLTRAIEWLNDEGQGDGWQPSLRWATRYAKVEEHAATEFAAVCDYVRLSATKAQEDERREQARIERERAEEEDRRERTAAAALQEKERERAEQTRRAEAAELLADTQARAARKQRSLLIGLFVLAFAASMAAGLAFKLRSDAVRAAHESKMSTGRALWAPVLFESGRLTDSAQDALLRVARAPSDVSSAFVHLMFEEDRRDQETYAQNFLHAPDTLLTASVGPSPKARNDVLRLAAEAAAAPASPVAAARDTSVRILAATTARMMLETTDGKSAQVDAFFDAIASRLASKNSEADELWRMPASLIATVGHASSPKVRAELANALKKRIGAGADAASLPWVVASVVNCDWLPAADRAPTYLEWSTWVGKMPVDSGYDLWASRQADQIQVAPGAVVSSQDVLFDGSQTLVFKRLLTRSASCLSEDEAIAALERTLQRPGLRLNPVDVQMLRSLLGRGYPKQSPRVMVTVLQAIAGAKLHSDPGTSEIDVAHELYVAYLHWIKQIPQSALLTTLPELEPYIVPIHRGASGFFALLALDEITRRGDSAATPVIRGMMSRATFPSGSANDDWNVNKRFALRAIRASLRAQAGESDAPLQSGAPQGGQQRAAPATATESLETVLEKIRGSDDADKLQPLGQTLSERATRLTPAEALSEAAKLLEARKGMLDSDRRSAVEKGLVADIDRIRTADASTIQRLLIDILRLATQIATGPTRPTFRDEPVANWTDAMRKLATELDPGTRMKLVTEVVDALIKNRPTPVAPDQLTVLDSGNAGPVFAENPQFVGGLVADLPSLEQRTAMRLRLLNGLAMASTSRKIASITVALDRCMPATSSASTGSAQPSKTGSGIAIKDEWRPIVERSIARLPQVTRAAQARMLARLVRTGLLEQGVADAAAAEHLFELLKYPSSDQAATVDAIHTLFTPQGAPPTEDGFWALVAWAHKAYPKLDLDGPARSAPPDDALAPL